MQYDAIILELMSRIQALEKEVGEIKTQLNTKIESPDSTEDGLPNESDAFNKQIPYSKMTDEMVRTCYELGEYAYKNPQQDINALAEKAVKTTGMNRNSAIIYIYVVKSMLNGEVYKRAINTTATREYLNTIYQKYGKDGLNKALTALGKHIDYRRKIGHTVDGLIFVYKTFLELHEQSF